MRMLRLISCGIYQNETETRPERQREQARRKTTREATTRTMAAMPLR